MAVMGTNTELKEFYKIRISKSACKVSPKGQQSLNTLKTGMQILWQHAPTKDNAQHMERCVLSATRLATSEEFVGGGGHGLLMIWSKRIYKTTPVKTSNGEHKFSSTQ